MRKEDILKLPSMPASGSSYPAGPYRFIHREFMVITYETDPDILLSPRFGCVWSLTVAMLRQTTKTGNCSALCAAARRR